MKKILKTLTAAMTAFILAAGTAAAPAAAAGMGGDPGGGFGGSSSGAPESYTAVVEYTETQTVSGATIESYGQDENAVLVATDDIVVTLEDMTVYRENSSSTGGDDASFYGVGASVLVTAGTLIIDDSSIYGNAAGAAGVFAYGDGTAYVSDTEIETVKDTSGGIHVAGGGTLYAWDLTVVTAGGSSAAIRSDRGGGTMVVDGGTYTSKGTGSPAIYSAGDITVNNATLTATASEAICMEGLNAIRLYDCDLSGSMADDSQNDCTWNIILYQSQSGDAEEGNAYFEMVGGSITAENGGMFYTTNTESTYVISGVDITYAPDSEFVIKCTGNSNARGWGSTGSNGANCTFTAIDQELEGAVIWDSISTLDLYLTEGSVLTGYAEDDESNAGSGGSGYANVVIDETSSWIVTADSTVTSLSVSGTITDAYGNSVSVVGTDGTVYVSGTSAYTITVESYSETADTSGASSVHSFSEYSVEEPESSQDSDGSEDDDTTTDETLDCEHNYSFVIEDGIAYYRCSDCGIVIDAITSDVEWGQSSAGPFINNTINNHTDETLTLIVYVVVEDDDKVETVPFVMDYAYTPVTSYTFEIEPGEQSLYFYPDLSNLAGKTLYVCYNIVINETEYVLEYMEGSQSIVVPSISTTATIDESGTITDTVVISDISNLPFFGALGGQVVFAEDYIDDNGVLHEAGEIIPSTITGGTTIKTVTVCGYTIIDNFYGDVVEVSADDATDDTITTTLTYTLSENYEGATVVIKTYVFLTLGAYGNDYWAENGFDVYPNKVYLSMSSEDLDDTAETVVLPVTETETETVITELYGSDRYETMKAIAEEAFLETGSTYAVIATGENYPDALAAASLAGVLDAPVILVNENKISVALETLDELNVESVYIVGGTASVSENIAAQIEEAGISVERIAGDTRQETALKIAEKVKELSAEDPSDTCLIAAGGSFPDALSGSPYSYWSGSPIYLAENDGSVSEAVIAAIEEGGYSRVIILGGEASVSAEAYAELENISGVTVTRLGGETRYETSVYIAVWSVAQGMSYDGLAVAAGMNYPDALCGAALCGQKGSVLLLANTTAANSTDLTEVLASQAETLSGIYILGGTSSVSTEVREEISSILN